VTEHGTKPRRLKVKLVHGALEDASHPVVVGHYQGTPLAGAEGALDKCLDGLLSERLLLGTYAEQEGTAIAIRAAPDCSPSGALVLGLGPSGEVSAAKIVRSMTQAALLRALAAVEEGEGKEIGLSAVLVGANPLDGISVQRSLAAMVDGVVAAAHMLSTSERLSSAVRFAELEIIEKYAARAENVLEAFKTMPSLVAPTGPDVELALADSIEHRPGGEPGGFPADYNRGAWLRLDIRAAAERHAPPKGYRELELTSSSRRARADRLLQRLEVATVDGLVSDAVAQPNPDPQIANTLYELLLPPELKPDLQGAENLLLMLEPGTAGYPWEALAPRGLDDKPQPYALGSGVLRQFADPETRNARFEVPHAAGRHVLVIGNPPAGGAPDLPGAAREAQAVAELLSGPSDTDGPFDVSSVWWDEDGALAVNLPTVEDDESWAHIVNALYRNQYRIVHIAAHGAFDPKKPDRSGVLIGPDHFLTAQTVAQLSAVPELVFLNCCHSARVDEVTARRRDNAHLLAASIARELMEIGVRAVVAAGWAVEDTAAVTFAKTFYGKMLSGSGFGDATMAARRDAAKVNNSMTWAAYQCYGDPEFRLHVAGAPQ
jgi:CHAT domain-containing protein